MGESPDISRGECQTQRNNIVLRGKAKLIIEDSLFRHHQPSTWGSKLEAEDESQVIIRGSVVKSRGWIPWDFRDNSTLILENTDNRFSAIWVGCGGGSSCVVRGSSKFEGTVYDSATLRISDTSPVFVELVFPGGSQVDESLPSAIHVYSFPGEWESGIPYRLEIKNAGSARWGISLDPNTEVAIRDAEKLSVGINIKEPYRNVRVELSDLKRRLYEDKTWVFENTSLHLVNTRVENWYPTAGDSDVLMVKNSDLADNAHSSDNAKIIYENVTVGFVRGRDRVEFTIRDSFIRGDVVAEDDSRVTLVNTKVRGKLIEKDNGRIILR